MYDVFGLGNALVDTEVNVDDEFLRQQQIAKGHMTLIDAQRREELSQALADQPHKQCSGGSAANTIYAAQAFGLQTAYTCKVANDPVGDFFIKELTDAGVEINITARADKGQSGQCFILITPDAERSMNTDLAISSDLSITDVPLEKLAGAKYFYVEGYLSSSEKSAAAAVACREASEQAGVQTCVSLSDPSMVEFFRESLQQMLGNGVTQIFCNEEEALTWAKTDRLDIAVAELKDIAPELYVTLGAKGSLAVEHGHQHSAAGVEVKAVDTTGAGDIYAGAVMAARLRGANMLDAARFANYAAAHIVTLTGARLHSVQAYQHLQQSWTP